MLKIPFCSITWRPFPFFGGRHTRSKLATLCLALLLALGADSNLAASGTGLVGYWSFDEGVGSTATDLSGNDNAGTLVNDPIWESGKVGFGLLFDGIDDYVAIPHTDTLNISKELTVSAWVLNRATGDNLLGDPEYHVIASKGWAPDQGGSWTLAWEKKTNSIAFFVRRSSNKGFSHVFFDYPGLAHDWHHITAVVGSGKLSLYVDGLLVAGPISLGGGSSMNMNTEEVRIGAAFSIPTTSIKSWDGMLDEVQIYNRALADAEIKALFDTAQSQPSSDNSGTESGGLTVESSASTTSKPGRGNEQVATPQITPNGGTHTGPVTVSLKTTTPGASIYYTTDGKSPDQSSTPYKDPFTIATDTMVKARAFKQNSPPSEEASAWFTISQQEFDFSLSNSGDKSTNKGSSAQNTISAALKSGNSQSISFVASGLPSGSSASFSSVSCNPSCSSTLTILTDSSTPAGIYSITATGSGDGKTRSTSFNLTVAETETASFDFSLSNGGDKSVTAGSSVNNSINATLVSGTTQAVSFGVSGLPSGTAGSFSPGNCNPTCSSTLTINAGSSTAVGTYTVTVTASGGGVNKSTSFKLTVNQPFDFSLSNSGDKSLTAGSSITNSITASLLSGTTQAVSFGVSGLPSGTTASFSPGSCNPDCSSTLTIDTGSSTAAGTYTVTVSGSGGGLSRSTSFNLTVSSPVVTSCPTGQFLAEYYNNMTLSGSPTATSCETSINYDWGTGGPGNGVGTDNFSVRWTGSFNFSAGTYTFTATADDGIRVWIDGTQIINAWVEQSPTTYQANATLTAGEHVIKVEYYENGGSAVAQVGWQAAPAKLTVTWQDNSDNEDNFRVERKKGTGGAYSEIAIVSANTTLYVDSSVTGGSTYCYRVRAANSFGFSDYSNEACQTVP